jgi:hypothetical protein
MGLSVDSMTPLHVVFVPVLIPAASGNVGWAKRALPPQYPGQHREHWPLHQSIPTDETRRMLDDARHRVTSERDQLRRTAREGLPS